MTHDTPPKRIWAWYLHPEMRNDVMEGGWTESPDKREAEYILTSEAEAMVAAALREAAGVAFDAVFDEMNAVFARNTQRRILALIPQPASAALSAAPTGEESNG